MSRIIRRGDIYNADIGHATGGEHGGNRPVLIIQNDVGTHHSHTIVVASITRKFHHRKHNPTHVHLTEGKGLLFPSIALLDHIRTIDRHRLTHFIGRLDALAMHSIDHAIAVSLGIPMNRNDSGNLLTLCGICLGQFINSNEHIVRRADHNQPHMDVCCYCSTRRGWDYIVSRRAR